MAASTAEALSFLKMNEHLIAKDVKMSPLMTKPKEIEYHAGSEESDDGRE